MTTLVNMVMNIQLPQNAEKLLTNLETVNLYRTTLLYKST